MNDRSDIDQVLRHWLDDGPAVMPDRVAVTVADRIAREPQRHPWRLDRRLRAMNPILKMFAAAAAVLVIAIVGWNLLPGPSTGVGGAPASPTPTASPFSTPSPSSLASPPAYTWPGPLAEGTYTTSLVWNLPFGVVFTVPDGWEAYDIEISKPGSHGLSVEFVLVENVFSDPCAGTPSDPQVGQSIDDLADAVTALSALDVTGPTPIDFDRSTSGVYLEYVIREDAGCVPSQYMLWDLPAESFLPGRHSGGDRKAVMARQGRVWILDVDGVRFVIRATWDPGATPAERDELQGIVDSIRFSRPGETPAPQPLAP